MEKTLKFESNFFKSEKEFVEALRCQILKEFQESMRKFCKFYEN